MRLDKVFGDLRKNKKAAPVQGRLFFMWREGDLNSRPPGYESDALTS
jgi:hypothetical protein